MDARIRPVTTNGESIRFEPTFSIPFDRTDFGTYTVQSFHRVHCIVIGWVLYDVTSSWSLVFVAPQLSCSPAPVSRGNSVTCTVSNVTSGQVVGWEFTGGGARVSRTGCATSWSGIMVQTGTITVSVFNTGYTIPKSVTVNPRSDQTSGAFQGYINYNRAPCP